MKVRIGPGFPLVWRTPGEAQLGAPEAAVRIDSVDDGIDRLLDRLRRGCSPEDAVRTAVRHGSSDARARAVLDLLAPALEPAPGADRRRGAPAPRAPGTASVAGDGPVVGALAEAVADALAARGVAPGEPGDRRAVLVVPRTYVVPPTVYQPLLADDRVHLAVTLEDRFATVGPLVVPGRTPCIRCDDLARRDLDPCWPAVATQLVGRRSPVRDPATIRQTADAAARVVAAFTRDGTTPPEHGVVRIEGQTGLATARARSFHAACGCRGLPRSA